MIHKIAGFYDGGFQLFNDSAFIAGYLLALLLFCVMLLAVLILYWIFFRRSHVSMISIPNSRGALLISAHAVSDLILSLDPEFDGISITKVLLFRAKRKQTAIDIWLEYSSHGTGLPELAGRLQERILERLKDSFGISSIQSVNIKVRRTRIQESSI